MPDARQIIGSYRTILRQGIHAIQNATPARYTLKSRVSKAFRTGDARDYDAKKIENTLHFLRKAAEESGLEHRVLKNVLFVWFWEKDAADPWRLCVEIDWDIAWSIY